MKPVDVLTPRQRAVVDTVERTGSVAAAARELGITAVSTGATYRRAMERLGSPTGTHHPRLTYREQAEAVGPRLDALEMHMASLLADQAASAVLLLDLATEIRAWTARQPLMVEMRPRHQRVADDGEGGTREAKRLRRVASA